MYQLHFDVFEEYSGDRRQLAYTDTDNFINHIDTVGLIEDNRKFEDIMDFSDYPLNHPLKSDQNIEVIVKLRDEMNGMQIHEFFGLKSKIYAIKSGDQIKKTSEGNPKVHSRKRNNI